MFPLVDYSSWPGSSVLDVDIASGVADPGAAGELVEADPRREYVSASEGIYRDVDRDFLRCESPFGGPYGWHGAETYELMYRTPAVGSSLNALRAGVLINGINLLPAIKPTVGLGKPGQARGTPLEADMAAEICESNRRLLDGWDTPADLVLWEHMEDMYLGHVLSEVVADDVRGGPDDGLLAIRAVKPKPRGAFRFRVDRQMNVLSIGARAVDEATGTVEWTQFEPEHFAWSTWDSYRGDPRGRSCFRMAHYHWKLLVELWPDIAKGWHQFGVPMLYGTTAQGATMVKAVDAKGRPIAGPGQLPEHQMARVLREMRGGSVATGPFGSDIKVVESTKDSSVAAGGVTMLEAEIKQSIILAIRATTEAQHGSKADSETSQDVMGTLIRFVRKGRERFLRQLLIKQNTWNYGEDIARRLTPLVDLGSTEHQDFSTNAAGVGVLYQASYFTVNQLPYVDTFLGLPQRQIGDQRVGPQGIVPDTPAPDPNAPAPADGRAPAPTDQAPAPKPVGFTAVGEPIFDVTNDSPVHRIMSAIRARWAGRRAP